MMTTATIKPPKPDLPETPECASEARMSLTDHLEEVRRRLIICLAAWGAATALAWSGTDEILSRLARPVGALIFTAPAEAFLSRLKIALWGGVFLAMPVFLFQAWRFLAAGMTDKEKKALFWILPSSYLLFLTGSGLALLGVLPAAIRFLTAYGSEELRPFLSVNAYLGFAGSLTLSFGLLFQLPLLLFFLAWAGILDARKLASWRKGAYVGSFILAALLTPGPDVFSQILLAVPTILLYEFSLFLIRLRKP